MQKCFDHVRLKLVLKIVEETLYVNINYLPIEELTTYMLYVY